jgi:hypothetical protein
MPKQTRNAYYRSPEQVARIKAERQAAQNAVNAQRQRNAAAADKSAVQRVLQSNNNVRGAHFRSTPIGDLTNMDPLGRRAREQAAGSYVPGAPSSLKRVPLNATSHAHIERYCEMLLNVHDTDPVQAPSPIPFRSVPAKQIITDDLATSYSLFSGSAQFYGEVQPNMDNTLLLTTPTAGLETTSAANAYNGDFWGVSADRANTPMLGGYMHGSISGNTMVAGVNLEGGTNGQLMCFPLVSSAVAITATFNFELSTTLDESLTIGVQAYSAGAWTGIGSGVVTGQSLSLPGLTVPANTQGLTFTLQCNELADREFVRVNFSVTRTAGGTWRLGAVPKNVSPHETTILANVSQLQYSRITAVDVLGTFQGADLSNGGTVACARVPKFWAGGSSNGYSDIVLLPYDSYDGELKHGWHTHWVPTSLDDISPSVQVGQFDSFGSTKLVFGGTINTAGQSVRVRCSIVVEYFSTAPSYGVMHYTPPPTDMTLALYYIATQVPACTSNREHIVKKLGALGSRYLGQALAYLKQHPELLFEVGSSIAAAVL